MSSELMSSPSVRRSNSYRIALRKSGVPKELYEDPILNINVDHVEQQSMINDNAVEFPKNDQQQLQLRQILITNKQQFKQVKEKRQELSKTPNNQSKKENFLMNVNCYDKEDGEHKLMLDHFFRETCPKHEQIVLNSQHQANIVEENQNEDNGTKYILWRHLFCLYCCCNYCCCLLRNLKTSTKRMLEIV